MWRCGLRLGCTCRVNRILLQKILKIKIASKVSYLEVFHDKMQIKVVNISIQLIQFIFHTCD